MCPGHCTRALPHLLAQPPLGQRVVCICVEHDGGKGQHVCGVGVAELVWVVAAVALSKLLHDAVNLLRFPGQPAVMYYVDT